MRSRWKRRLGAISSPLIEPATYRALFILIVIGVLLISVLPEAALVLPTVDAVGLDIVTIFAAFELRHYFASVAHLARIPTSVAVYLLVPALWLYACMWPLIWHHMLMGKIIVSPPARL